MKLVLTDFYHQATRRFLSSLTTAEVPYQHVTVNYNGFLPNDVLNPFSHAISAEDMPDHDLHYNQIKVPEFYEIRNTDGTKAEILYGDNLMGYVHYAPHSHRLVREVLWLNKKAVPTLGYRYNRKGFKYSDVLYNFEGKAVKELYFNARGEQVLTVDLMTGVIISPHQVFSNLAEFVANYLKGLDFDYDEILINSMSTPFFVTNRMANKPSSLYFQETIKQELPGNMTMILDGKTSTRRILFENEKELQKVKRLTSSQKADLLYLGAIEDFRRENAFRKKFLTITRSDQILYDKEIANALKEKHATWTIAAPSEVSDKLRAFATEHENVSVLEAIRRSQLPELLSEHDIYLDLNQGTDWEDVIQSAYLEGMLVISDKKTAKNPGYELVLEKEEIEEVISSADKASLLALLHEKKGQPASKKDYKEILS